MSSEPSTREQAELAEMQSEHALIEHKRLAEEAVKLHARADIEETRTYPRILETPHDRHE